LARGAVAGDGLPRSTSVDQEPQDVALGPPYPLGELAVHARSLEAGASLEIRDRRDRAAGLGGVLGMANVQAQRAAMRAELLDVDHREPVGCEDPRGGAEREVREVLVIDLVELVALQRAQEVRKLDGQEAIPGEQGSDPIEEVVEAG